MRRKLSISAQESDLTQKSLGYGVTGQVVRNLETLKRQGFSNLKILRYERGLTLEDLSSLTSISPSYLSRLECGARRLNTDLLKKLSAVLGCEQADLLGTVRPSEGYNRRASVTQENPKEADKDLPVYRLATAESLMTGEESMQSVSFDLPVDWTYRPHALINLPKAFGLCVADDGYAPYYRTGDVVFVHPTRPLSARCMTFVVSTDNRSFLTSFVAWKKNSCVFQPLQNDLSEEEMPKDTIRSLQRVTGCMYA